MAGLLSTLWVIAFFNSHPVTLVNNSSEAFLVRQGWYNGHSIRYVPFAASNRKLTDVFNMSVAQDQGSRRIDYAPALQCTIDKEALGEVYFLNGGQDAIFSADPTYIGYTPLWRVHYLAWIPGTPGIHLTSEAEVESLLNSPNVSLVEILPPSVLDATIVIDSNGKLTPQALNYDYTYGQEKIWFKVFKAYYLGAFYFPQVRYIALCDVSDANLATSTGANYAPYLANAYECCNLAYAFENPSPFSQYPIINQVQQYNMLSGLQLNQSYTPLKCWTLFQRGMLDSNAIINNPNTMMYLENSGTVTMIDMDWPIVTNSPVVDMARNFGNIGVTGDIGELTPISVSQTPVEKRQRR